jgi:hypothetical protein
MVPEVTGGRKAKAERIDSMISITVRIFFIFSALMLNAPFCHGGGAENWDLVKSNPEDGIDIYFRVLPTGNIEFKGITTIETSLSSFVALFNDTDTMHRWVYRTEKVTVLKREGDKDVYVYTIHTIPFSFTKRDSVIHSSIRQDPESRSVTIRAKAKPDYLPKQKGLARLRSVESFWHFEPQNNGNVTVTFQGYGDPGGGLLASIYRSPFFRWLCNYFLWRMPHSTLKKMKHIIHDDKYQTPTFSFIHEPDRRKQTNGRQ